MAKIKNKIINVKLLFIVDVAIPKPDAANTTVNIDFNLVSKNGYSLNSLHLCLHVA